MSRYSELRLRNLCCSCRQPAQAPRCAGCYEKRRESAQRTRQLRRQGKRCLACDSKELFDNTAYCKQHAIAKRLRDKKFRQRLKIRVFNAYGGFKCSCCGETGESFLAIDHINNDGAEHRKKLSQGTGSRFYQWLSSNNFPDGFQVLCFNCNHSKSINRGVCEHQIKRGDK